MWEIKLTLERKRFLHLQQTSCSPTPCLSLKWIFKLSERLKAWPQTWQRHKTGSAWWHIFWWRVRFPDWLNNFPQTAQAYFPSRATRSVRSVLVCKARKALCCLQNLGLCLWSATNKQMYWLDFTHVPLHFKYQTGTTEGTELLTNMQSKLLHAN